MRLNLSDPKGIAELGEKIYAERYQADYEAKYRDQFVVIDVKTGKAYLGLSPVDAYNAARQDASEGLFYLIKIGEPGAYRVSYSSDVSVDWFFQ